MWWDTINQKLQAIRTIMPDCFIIYFSSGILWVCHILSNISQLSSPWLLTCIRSIILNQCKWSNLTQCFWIKTTNNMWVMHDEQKINVSNMEEKSCCGRLFSHIFMFHRDLDSKFSSAQWMYWTLLSLSWKSVGAAHCCQHWDRGMRQQKESTSSALKPSALSATTWHTEEREDALVRMELHQPSR